MRKFDFVPPLLDYVRSKVKSFLDNHGLESTYDSIEQSAKENMSSVTDYINRLVNETVSEVAHHENEDWSKIGDELTVHYFSKK